MDERRGRRVSERIKEELHEILNYELSDPRVGETSITDVLLSQDARRARVRLALSGGTDEQEMALEALQRAKAHIRRLLAGRIDMYRVPELEFEKDVGVETNARLRSLMRKVRKGRPREESPSPPAPDEEKSPLK